LHHLAVFTNLSEEIHRLEIQKKTIDPADVGQIRVIEEQIQNAKLQLTESNDFLNATQAHLHAFLSTNGLLADKEAFNREFNLKMPKDVIIPEIKGTSRFQNFLRENVTHGYIPGIKPPLLPPNATEEQKQEFLEAQQNFGARYETFRRNTPVILASHEVEQWKESEIRHAEKRTASLEVLRSAVIAIKNLQRENFLDGSAVEKYNELVRNLKRDFPEIKDFNEVHATFTGKQFEQ
jgi:hypothetical protein